VTNEQYNTDTQTPRKQQPNSELLQQLTHRNRRLHFRCLRRHLQANSIHVYREKIPHNARNHLQPPSNLCPRTGRNLRPSRILAGNKNHADPKQQSARLQVQPKTGRTVFRRLFRAFLRVSSAPTALLNHFLTTFKPCFPQFSAYLLYSSHRSSAKRPINESQNISLLDMFPIPMITNLEICSNMPTICVKVY
jgi:hypothetical protein